VQQTNVTGKYIISLARMDFIIVLRRVTLYNLVDKYGFSGVTYRLGLKWRRILFWRRKQQVTPRIGYAFSKL